LGGCTAYDVVNILTKKRKELIDLEISVSGEQAPDPPWTFTHIHMIYRLRGRGLTEKAVQDAIELSKNKYCSVGATCAEAAEITYEFTIEEE
jgi:putative redox protein